MRMQLAPGFDDTRAAEDAARTLISGLNPTLEVEVPYQMADVINAFGMAQQNNLDLKLAVNPDSPNGREITEMLTTMASRVAAGQKASDVLRDASQMKAAGSISGINFFDRKSSPLLWTDVFGAGQDAATYANKIGSNLERLKVTNSDAGVYAASVYKQYYREAFGQVYTSNRAVDMASQRIEAEHLPVKGSLIAKRDLPADWRDSPEFMKTWLSIEFPKNADATLVPVSRNTNGTMLYAARNAAGDAIANELYTTKDFVLTPAQFIEAVLKSRKSEREFNKSFDTYYQPPRIGQSKQ
jgi:hypothetical protein